MATNRGIFDVESFCDDLVPILLLLVYQLTHLAASPRRLIAQNEKNTFITHSLIRLKEEPNTHPNLRQQMVEKIYSSIEAVSLHTPA